MRKFIILPALALLAGCAADGQKSASVLKYEASETARLEKELAGLVAGKPQSCIRLRDTNGSDSFGDNILLFRVSRNLVYTTKTSGSCDNIRRHDALITRTFGSDLCRGDIAQTADMRGGFQTGVCAMGEFVPHRKPKAG